jgi:hypothetical protein
MAFNGTLFGVTIQDDIVTTGLTDNLKNHVLDHEFEAYSHGSCENDIAVCISVLMRVFLKRGVSAHNLPCLSESQRRRPSLFQLLVLEASPENQEVLERLDDEILPLICNFARWLIGAPQQPPVHAAA